jgi:HAE1 family hydrophobic/amphiphilic exporter-1
VGDVTSIGQDFSMRVWLQPDRLGQLGLTPADITDALREQNVQVAAGSVGSTPQYGAQAFEYTVFMNGRLTETEEFGNIVVRTNPADGSLVHLRDVARLELGQFDYARTSTVNNQPATIC